MRRGGAGDAPQGIDVEGHDLGPERVVGFRETAARDKGTGVVDEHIESAEALHRGGDESGGAVGGGEIRGRGAGSTTEVLSLGGEGPRAVGAGAVVHEDVAAGGRQLAGDGEADALGAGGDECAFAEEFAHDY